jgi:hypothetical protein
MTKYWFKPKSYGYGMMPISWEGWLVTLIFVGILALSAYSNQMFLYPRPEEIASFLIDTGILTALFLILFKDKTNGKIRWNWGKDGKWF